MTQTMKIRTFGQTAEQPTPTRAQVVETMNFITDVHRKVRGEADYLCTYAHAREITARMLAGRIDTKIAARASRLDGGGRIWRARIRLA